MARSKLMDRGEEICEIYPEVIVIDERGIQSRRAGTKPERYRVTVSKERQSTSDLIGQVSIRMLRVTTRHMAGGDYARAWFRGEWWDVQTQPHLSTGASKATRHWEFTLRSRNSLGDDPQQEDGGAGG